MNKQILEALMLRYQAKRAEGIVNLNTYLTAAVGVGEHPNIVDECDKLMEQISSAQGKMDTIVGMIKADEENAKANAKEDK